MITMNETLGGQIIRELVAEKPVVTILSGGLDSSTLAYFLADLGAAQRLISFDYGQRHKKELVCAKQIAKNLGCLHHIIDLTSVQSLFTGSSLTDSAIAVPEGHYAKESMKATIVPNRNAIMLSIAWGVAISDKAVAVAYGAHAGDHAIYPDCRPEFTSNLNSALQMGSPDDHVGLLNPFIDITKTDILKMGLSLKVPYEQTWTCYKGGTSACGRCGTCCERLEAFAALGEEDPLSYEDREFWKTAVAEFKFNQ